MILKFQCVFRSVQIKMIDQQVLRVYRFILPQSNYNLSVDLLKSDGFAQCWVSFRSISKP